MIRTIIIIININSNIYHSMINITKLINITENYTNNKKSVIDKFLNTSISNNDNSDDKYFDENVDCLTLPWKFTKFIS